MKEKAISDDLFYEIIEEATYMVTRSDKDNFIDLLYAIASDMNFKDSIEYIQEYRIKNNQCPVCREDLTSVGHNEDRGEYFGCPSQETVYTLECEYCGWQDDN